MNPIDYLDSLISGSQNSSIPVQMSELKALLALMRAQVAPAPAAVDPAVEDRVRQRLQAAKPPFTAEQIEAASKLPQPAHLFQGADVPGPDAAQTEKYLRERAHRAWVASTIETMNPERVFVRGYLAAHVEEGLDPYAEPGPWMSWTGDYEKQAYDVWVSGCDVVFGCWPNDGVMVATDGSSRQWRPGEVLAVRVSAYQSRYPRPFKKGSPS